jgi:ornithine decarboxylase
MKPKFILSKRKVLQQYNIAKGHADIISYSSKTNQDITKILENNTNCLFSVHFINELKHLKDYSRVVFLAQGWNEEEITHLTKLGVKWFIVDNESDLDVLQKFLETYEGKINLLLRLKIRENSIRTEKYFVFGMKAEVINKRIKDISKDKIETLGIHFHRKTQNLSEWNYQLYLSQMIDKEALNKIDYLNIGGGLPSDYANTNVNVLPSILEKITELREWLDQQKIKLMLEPGRFIAAPAVRLVTKIVGIHGNNIIVNASVYNSDMDAIVVPVKLLVEGELQKGEGPAYVIKGITPCSLDLFRYRVYLKDPKVGDTLTFLNAGAYNFTTDFCDLEKIEVEEVE